MGFHQSYYTCDMCGCKLDSGFHYDGVVECWNESSGCHGSGGYSTDWGFCKTCYAKVLEFLKNWKVSNT